jgi:hypothetical protein
VVAAEFTGPIKITGMVADCSLGLAENVIAESAVKLHGLFHRRAVRASSGLQAPCALAFSTESDSLVRLKPWRVSSTSFSLSSTSRTSAGRERASSPCIALFHPFGNREIKCEDLPMSRLMLSILGVSRSSSAA